jgi:hypothetical protein
MFLASLKSKIRTRKNSKAFISKLGDLIKIQCGFFVGRIEFAENENQ